MTNVLHAVVLASPSVRRELRGGERVAQQTALSRAALARSAQLSGAELTELAHDAAGAPLASNGWHWSLAHTSGRSAGVVARAAVGIDVEAIEPRNQDVVHAATSRDELELFGGFTWERFVRAWTAKEAVLKRAGCGLAELSRCIVVAVPREDAIVVSHRGRDHYVRQSTRDRHVAALAFDDPGCEVEWSWEAA